MKLLSNPLMLRMVLALFFSALVCVVGFIAFLHLRRRLTDEGALDEAHPEPEQFLLHTYHAVIQQLKQQKHELASAQQVERRRAKTSENISSAVLSHLSCGVMFFTPNGLARQTNAAAKSILGFASPVGMSITELFREATVNSDGGPELKLAAAVQQVVRQKTPRQNVEAQYVTPAGERRTVALTLLSVPAPSGEVLGVACLIEDKTALAMVQKQEELRKEMSAEMALTLRTSLASITAGARQMVKAQNPAQSQQNAADIVSEAAQLEQTLGSFLAGGKVQARAAGA